MDAPPPIKGPLAPALNERFQEGYLGQHGRLLLAELTLKSCRFPIDQLEGPVKYCGELVTLASAWCEHHARRCLGVRK